MFRPTICERRGTCVRDKLSSCRSVNVISDCPIFRHNYCTRFTNFALDLDPEPDRHQKCSVLGLLSTPPQNVIKSFHSSLRYAANCQLMFYLVAADIISHKRIGITAKSEHFFVSPACSTPSKMYLFVYSSWQTNRQSSRQTTTRPAALIVDINL